MMSWWPLISRLFMPCSTKNMPSVVMKEGMRKDGRDVAVDEPDQAAEAERDGERQPFVHVVGDEQDRPDDRHEGEILSDREVEFAGDHEHRHADRDDADGGGDRADRGHRLR